MYNSTEDPHKCQLREQLTARKRTRTPTPTHTPQGTVSQHTFPLNVSYSPYGAERPGLHRFRNCRRFSLHFGEEMIQGVCGKPATARLFSSRPSDQEHQQEQLETSAKLTQLLCQLSLFRSTNACLGSVQRQGYIARMLSRI